MEKKSAEVSQKHSVNLSYLFFHVGVMEKQKRQENVC